jgi:hypothetical protein
LRMIAAVWASFAQHFLECCYVVAHHALLTPRCRKGSKRLVCPATPPPRRVCACLPGVLQGSGWVQPAASPGRPA